MLYSIDGSHSFSPSIFSDYMIPTLTLNGAKVVSVEDLLLVIEAKHVGDVVNVKLGPKCDERLEKR